MTNQNTNVQNMTAKELLADWTNGMGATGKNPELYSHVVDGQLRGKAISLSLMTALLEWQYKGNDEALSYIEQGYLSKNHFNQYQQETAVKTPLKGHVLTSTEYYNNCLALFPKPDVTVTRELLNVDTAKATKVELATLVDKLKAMYIPALSNEQQLQFETLKQKEEQAEKALALFSNYQTKVISENIINVKCDMTEIKSLKQTINDNGFKITTAVPDMEQMLMSVNVDIKQD